jgi:hypothetical protein
MKQHESQFDTLMEMAWERGVQLNHFFRKGQAGDWKEHLSREQEEAFEREFAKVMGDLGPGARGLGGPAALPPAGGLAGSAAASAN